MPDVDKMRALRSRSELFWNCQSDSKREQSMCDFLICFLQYNLIDPLPGILSSVFFFLRFSALVGKFLGSIVRCRFHLLLFVYQGWWNWAIATLSNSNWSISSATCESVGRHFLLLFRFGFAECDRVDEDRRFANWGFFLFCTIATEADNGVPSVRCSVSGLRQLHAVSSWMLTTF